jgi:hypothetical protein
MVRKSILLFLLFCFVGTGFIAPSGTLHPRECWWEIIIQLTSKGTYSLEKANTSYSGKYGYTIQWSGCMEQDGEDFILYYENSELLRWEPQENKKRSDISEIKMTKEFTEKPSFAFNYILTKKDNIHFDFLIRGFHVPQQNQNSRYYLHLPASKENSYHPTDIAYDLHVNKGSNHVHFSRADLLKEHSKKDFHWSWKRHSSLGSAKEASYLTHSYDVDVEISILRRLKKNPADR